LNYETVQNRIAPKTVEIHQDNMRMEFLALNVDFDGPSFDFFNVQGNLHTKASKSGTSVKVVILPPLASLL